MPQGSTYVYTTYLQPFLLQNESDLDAGIITIQRNILTFIQGKLSVVWDLVWSVSNRNTQTQSANPEPGSTPQLSWFLSSDVWRSAINLVQASPSRADADHSTLTTPPQNKNVAASEIPSTPPFPTPQHYQ
jgi:receptor expression-enhancing protein 1/2/3/4